MRGGGGGAGGQWEAEGGGAAGGGDDVITIGHGGGERASVAMETAAPGSPPVPPPAPPPLESDHVLGMWGPGDTGIWDMGVQGGTRGYGDTATTTQHTGTPKAVPSHPTHWGPWGSSPMAVPHGEPHGCPITDPMASWLPCS